MYATTEQPSATRTSLNVDEGDETVGYEVLWSAYDKIMLINEALASIYAEFTLINDYDKKSTGEFTGSPLDDGTYTAYYPADYDGTSWPTAQTYVENNIPDGVPMKAENVEVADGDVAPISFKNEGGILRLNLKGEAKVTSITISATDLDAITLSCGTGVQLDADMATPFYIAVPGADDPGTAYSGLKIEITDDAGKVCTKTLKSDKTITVQRSMITDINLTASNFAFPFGQGEAAATGIGNVRWIQLWAEGPKFAEYNYGAEKAENYGKYINGTNAQTNKYFGDNWRLPTTEEYEALIDNCTFEWITVSDVAGLKVIGKDEYSSNSIFLPAAGSSAASSATEVGEGGYYWTSTSQSSNYDCLTFCNLPGLDVQIIDLPGKRKQSVRYVLAE